MRGAATQAMPVCIVEARQQSRYAPLPPRPSGLRPAGPLAVLLAPYIPHRVCSSLAPCQRAWGPAAKCTPYFLTGPNVQILVRRSRIFSPRRREEREEKRFQKLRVLRLFAVDFLGCGWAVLCSSVVSFI